MAQIDDSDFEHECRNVNFFMRLELESYTLDQLDDFNDVAILVRVLKCIKTLEFLLQGLGTFPHDQGVYFSDVHLELALLLKVQVGFFLPSSEDRSGVPDGVGWGYKGQYLEPEHDEEDIWYLIIFVGYLSVDSFYCGLEVICAVRLCAV